jgi:murein DD-endopeptidase MepM/ murein hydrolase activator NlpD
MSLHARIRSASALAAWLLALACLTPAMAQNAAAGAKAAGKATLEGKAQARKAPARSASKGPVAAKNVAVGAAAASAAPTAVMTQGCADSSPDERLAGELAIAANDARAQARAAAAGDQAGPCVPFASVRSTSPMFEAVAYMTPGDSEIQAEARRALVVSFAGGRLAAPTKSWHELPALEPSAPEVWLAVEDLFAGKATGVPARSLRELTVLVRLMRRSAEDAPWVRLLLAEEGDAARIEAVELIDANGEAVDSAIWMERGAASPGGLPGGFISTRGADHERILWQSPVDFRRISRGVGWANIIVRKRVVVPAKSAGGRSRVVVRSFRSRGQHQGVDYAAPLGTPVVTVADGTVVHAGPNGGYGNLVVVDHGAGITTYYAHLSAFGEGVQEGARVERGQEIGLVGSTGRSTGPHLHFEIRKDGKYLDPADPKQTLPNWSLAADEQVHALVRLLALTHTRAQGFAAATRAPLPGAAASQVVSVGP